VDLKGLVAQVESLLEEIRVPLRVAVMGCEVNGPGEARDADVGVAVAGGRGVLFLEGKPIARLERQEIVPALLKEVRRLADAGRSPAGAGGESAPVTGEPVGGK
jgi:(E)-4-hydroxy-3-methylbut-2-enyl-diphosphate synthase